MCPIKTSSVVGVFQPECSLTTTQMITNFLKQRVAEIFQITTIPVIINDVKNHAT